MVVEQVLEVPKISSRDRILQGTAELVEQLLNLPNTVFQDRFQERTVERIADISVLAQLALRISTIMKFGAETGDGPFVKVKGSITESISRLLVETSSQVSLKAYCNVEMSAATEKEGDEADTAKHFSKLEAAVDGKTSTLVCFLREAAANGHHAC